VPFPSSSTITSDRGVATASKSRMSDISTPNDDLPSFGASYAVFRRKITSKAGTTALSAGTQSPQFASRHAAVMVRSSVDLPDMFAAVKRAMPSVTKSFETPSSRDIQYGVTALSDIAIGKLPTSVLSSLPLLLCRRFLSVLLSVLLSVPPSVLSSAGLSSRCGKWLMHGSGTHHPLISAASACSRSASNVWQKCTANTTARKWSPCRSPQTFLNASIAARSASSQASRYSSLAAASIGLV
jgi:hypothetical protein